MLFQLPSWKAFGQSFIRFLQGFSNPKKRSSYELGRLKKTGIVRIHRKHVLGCLYGIRIDGRQYKSDLCHWG